MSRPSDIAYQIDPALWVSKVLGYEPAPWQAQFLRAPQGASILPRRCHFNSISTNSIRVVPVLRTVRAAPGSCQ